MKHDLPEEPLTPDEARFLARLREHPELKERFASILDLTANADGPVKTADEVEGLLIQELRQLGHTFMTRWAGNAGRRVGDELKQQDASGAAVKKTLTWWCVFGRVSVPDRVWRNAGHPYLRPLPQRLGVTPQGRSRRLDRALTDFGCEHSFARAAGSVLEHYGFEIGPSAVRDATLAQARKARAQLETEYGQPFRALPAEGEKHVVAQADGTMICTVPPGPRKGRRPRAWKEMRLVAAQALGRAATVYGATFGSVAKAGRRWGHCARQAGWGMDSQIHALGDGAGWVCGQAREVFGAQGRFLCDFFHVGEYLGAAAPVCRPGRPDQWRHTQQERLRRGDVAKVMASLEENWEPEGTPEEEAPVRAGHRYLNNRLDCLDYPRALALGLPIGSGLIESGHRHVLQARLKKAGTAWLEDHADQMAHLRVLRANDQWSSLWN